MDSHDRLIGLLQLLQRLLGSLVVQLRRMNSRRWQARSEKQRDLGWEIVERIAHPVFVCHADGRLHLANAAGRTMLARADVVRADDGVLAGVVPADNSALRRWILQACRGNAGDAAIDDGRVSAIAMPLHGEDATLRRKRSLFEPQLALLVLVTATAAADFYVGFAARFGLTAAEARLVSVLAEGDTLAEAALRVGVQPATVRSQLKAVFQKTGVRRQSALLAMVFTDPAFHWHRRGISQQAVNTVQERSAA